MTAIWEPPSRGNPIFYLPSTDGSNAVPASLDLVSIWEIGPLDGSVAALAASLYVLTLGVGDLIRQGQGNLQIFEKETAQDYVTNVDLGVEWIIREWFRRFRPNDRIVGEEGDRDSFLFDDIVWFIDPIDGTTNFIEGSPNVTVHIGSIFRGDPFISVVGLPIAQRAVVSFESSVLGEYPISQKLGGPLIIGTEYRSDGSPEHHTMHAIEGRFSASTYRIKSIGMNGLGLLSGTTDAFYKPKAKYWDVIAPLGLVAQLCPGLYKMSVTYLSESGAPISRPLFGFDPSMVAYINSRHETNCRIGLVTVVPIGNPDLETAIVEEVTRCMSLSC